MKKIVYIAPHLSTGGMPQYLYKQMELLNSEFELYCIEWGDVTGGVLVVQRNRIKSVLENKLITLSENKHELFNHLDRINPDIVHLQEVPELFMEYGVACKLYSKDRKYSIIETSHDSSYDVNSKLHFPDKFLLVSQYQIDNFKKLGIPCDLVEYPIEVKARTKDRAQLLKELGLDPNIKHVINVGLFTPRKNQAEVIEYARQLKDYPIQFHFLGNHADNFKWYWEPLMKDFPSNCKWWNERDDVDKFYEAADLFLFTSRGSETDKETMPLVIREAIGWNVPSLIYNLSVYLDYFDKYDNINYLNFNDKSDNLTKILNVLGIEKSNSEVFHTMKGTEQLGTYQYLNTTFDNLQKYGDAGAQYFSTYILKELEHKGVSIEPGDVFVDLGANIGISSAYAKHRGAGEIHCFEPDHKLISMIEKNVPTAKIHNFAIGASNDTIELFHWPYNEVHQGPKYSVSVITLSDVIKRVNKPIDYLKIDIEGFEEHLFDGLTKNDCSDIKKMFIEHHGQPNIDGFYNKLKNVGFDIIHTSNGRGQTYIYAINSKYNKNKMNISSSYERPGKIYVTNNDFTDIDVIVSVRDLDTKIPIYYCDVHFKSNANQWWIMPMMNYDWEADKYIGSFLLEFYDKNGNLLATDILKIKDRETPVVIATRPYSPFDCLWINYCQFFYDDIYKDIDLKDMGVVIDIGANVGLWSNYILNKKAKTVHAVEPTKKAFDELKKQFEGNDSVVLHKLAIGNSDGTAVIYSNDDNSTVSSLLTKTGQNITEEKVDVLTLKSFYKDLGLEKVDLVKVDIEGMEYPMFEKASDDDIRFADRYLVEYHHNDVDVEPARKLIDRFEKLGYELDVHADSNDDTLGPQGFFLAKKKVNTSNVVQLPKRAFVTYTNEYYLPIVERLVKSVSLNSQYPIVVYAMNCEVPFSYPNMIVKHLNDSNLLLPKFLTDKSYVTRKYSEYDITLNLNESHIGTVDRMDKQTYLTMSRKPTIMLHAICDGLEEGIFLDGDGLAKENIDSAFEYLKQCEDYPLVGKGLFEYMLLHGKGDPNTGDCLEKPLMDLLNVTTRSMHYVSTNFMVFTNKMKPFIEELVELTNHPTIIENSGEYAPFQDETLMNVLLWKHGATKQLPVSHFNLIDSKRASEFYLETGRDIYLDSEWQYMPENKDDIKYFHGCKSVEELDKTIEVININKTQPSLTNFVGGVSQVDPNKYNYSFQKISYSKNAKIAIVTLFDKNYEAVSKLSLPNKEKYAKKHGYDFIYFDDVIDKSRPAQWSKIKAVEYCLTEYEWVWWIDIDAIIMNDSIKLETIIDNKYDIILTENKHSHISNGSSFYKNSKFTFDFLNDCYELKLMLLQDIDVETFDHEQKPMRKLIQSIPEVASRVKLINERVCNSYCKTKNKSVLDNYPTWNEEPNIYESEDFVIQFCGRTFEERLVDMKSYLLKAEQKIIDCFMFFNELDVLETRLNLLYDKVDAFILVEATQTHTGEPKELVFAKNRNRFGKLSDKIIYKAIDITIPVNPNDSAEEYNKKAWQRERFQRNYISNILKECRFPDDTIVMISDVDEIPNMDSFYKENINLDKTIYYFNQKLYYYYYNNLSDSYWTGTIVGKYTNLKNKVLSNYRKMDEFVNVIPNGGWHFSYIGDTKSIRTKLKSFAHTEYNDIDEDTIKLAIENGTDLIPNRNIRFSINNDGLPEYILKNKIKASQYRMNEAENVIIINSHINNELKANILKSNLERLKKLNTKIVLVSNSILTKDILKLADYYIYSDENILLPKEKSPINWYADENETIHVYTTGIGYAIIRNMNMALNFVQNLKFKRFFYMEYDSIFTDNDLNLVKSIFSDLHSTNKKAWFCEFEKYGKCFETRIFAADVDFFIKNIPLPNTYDEWNDTPPYNSKNDTLEYIFPILFEKFKDDVIIFDGYNRDFFKNSRIDVFNATSDINIVYNNEDPNTPLVFIIGDDAWYELIIDGQLILDRRINRGELVKHYFPLLDSNINIMVTKDHVIHSFDINPNTIEEYKKTAIRYKLPLKE